MVLWLVLSFDSKKVLWGPVSLFALDWHPGQGVCLFSAQAPAPHDPEYELEDMEMDKWMETFCFIGLLFLSSRRGMLLPAQVTKLGNSLARVVNINLLLFTDLGVLFLSIQTSRPDFRKKKKLDIAVS